MISSYVNPSSRGGVRQHDQSPCSGSSHSSESEGDFQLSESVFYSGGPTADKLGGLGSWGLTSRVGAGKYVAQVICRPELH